MYKRKVRFLRLFSGMIKSNDSKNKNTLLKSQDGDLETEIRRV